MWGLNQHFSPLTVIDPNDRYRKAYEDIPVVYT